MRLRNTLATRLKDFYWDTIYTITDLLDHHLRKR